MPQRHQFNKLQLEQYFDRIRLPSSQRIFDVSNLSGIDKLSFLKTLHRHHLCCITWENLSQHYSWHRTVNVDPQHVFDKIVTSTLQPPSTGSYSPGINRGGYCMEVNFFQHLILHSLKFDTYLAGARIYRNAELGFGGWTHCVSIVCIDGIKYMLDGGYGFYGFTFVIPLRHDVVYPHVRTGGDAQSRLVYESTSQHSNADSRVWIAQYRSGPSAQWRPLFCFPDVEFLPVDVQSMNFAPWLDRQTFFTHKVVANRFTTQKESQPPFSPKEDVLKDDAEIDGALILAHDELKWRRSGQVVLRLKLDSEQDRLDCLEKYFGIKLAECDNDAIKGSAAELTSGTAFQP